MPYLSRDEEALVALGSMPAGQATPVQAVKMLFLMEKKVSAAIGGAKFHFVPYDYGPFDSAVYSAFENLQREGFIEVIDGKPRLYRLTGKGCEVVKIVINRLDTKTASYLSQLGNWISGLSFAQLVSAIYSEYPEMRANSIFRG